MNGRKGARALLGAVLATIAVLAPAAPAAAQIIGPQNPDEPKTDSPWQAGTCYTDTPTCSVATPLQFFEQAAGHPPVGFTQFIVNEEPFLLTERPVGNLRTVRVDLPPGLAVNPQATPEQCDLAIYEHPGNCPLDTKVGISEVTATNPTTGLSPPLPAVNVYNLKPRPGEPARFGLTLVNNDIFLNAGVAWESDYHEFFTIDVAQLSLGPGLEVARVAKNRLVFDGTSGDGTFITTPTTCFGPAVPGSQFEHIYSTWLRADSYEEKNPTFPEGSEFIESKIPRDPPSFETSPKECDSIPYDPSIEVDPQTAQTDSPSGPSVAVHFPEIKDPLKEEKQATSQTRSAKVTLPAGMGLNPSAANGLQTCSDAQFGKGTRNPVACPAPSKIGTVSVETPPLPDGSLGGDVYVGKQLSRDPTSGEEYRIFVDVESQPYAISARLLGKVSADPQTGQLTTTFDDAPQGKVPIPGLPQVPLRDFTLNFDDGARAVLTSPTTCGPAKTETALTPWSGNPAAHPSADFSLSAAPGGGKCAKTGAERPFAPSFAAQTAKPVGGAFSPFGIELTRTPGSQELKGAEVLLPPGVSAKLKGVRYCPESALASATAQAGLAEIANPSCPGSSFVGDAQILTGSGPSPIQIAGKVYLAGPYRGAPLSLAVITPATAGPFDLGTVVVRVALFVQPETAQVQAVSDAIPHVYGGALLDIHSVSMQIDRPNFSLNPTNCSPLASAATLHGGANDPNDPAGFSSYATSVPFQVNGCEKLGFKPKLSMRLFGARRRAKNPKLRATLVARGGDANVGRAAVTLPNALILDQANLSKVCTRVQFAAHACPKKSIYGYARAETPLLDGPLQGPVYLRSSNNPLPDLVADLRGQIEIVLVSRTDSTHGRIRSTFDRVPDAPVSKFTLSLRGGPKGLLVNSRGLCPKHRKAKGKGSKPLRSIARFKAQNGKKANMRPKLRTPCRRSHS